MYPYRPHHTHSRRILRAVAWCTLMISTAIVVGPGDWSGHRSAQAAPHFSGKQRFVPVFFKPTQAHSGEEGVLPTVLSDIDRGRYRVIFAAQKKADWTTADKFIGELENDVLLGTVIAERLLSDKYVSSPQELANWLRYYKDHPHAADIYSLALRKDSNLRKKLPYISEQRDLGTYGDSFNISVHSYKSAYSGYWDAGIRAWKHGQRSQAAKHFAALAKRHEYISEWLTSASAFWAYRSYKSIGQTTHAQTYLKQAAEYPRTFYGILARKTLNIPLGLDTQPVQLSENDILQMVGDQSARRIIALTETEQNKLADSELRWRFPRADASEKNRLLALAHELGLASVQMSMAHVLGVEGRELDFARYPIPNWQPQGGFKVDPLLIYSLMRQESGFRSRAVSSVGALGLMQLMPQTASMMHKQVYGAYHKFDRNKAAEPILNMTLGQNYVANLLENPLVENNLLYMLVAYNAGPGRLQNWKKDLHYRNDPLLFIESIPFNETRTYVMQVMTNYWVYAELLGTEERSIGALLAGKWPAYAGVFPAESKQALRDAELSIMTASNDGA